MIKNIVLDIGNVLVDFGWHSFFAGFGYSEDEIEEIAKVTVKDSFWNEIDRGVMSEEDILAGFIGKNPAIEDKLKNIYSDFRGLLVQFEYAKGWITFLKKKGYKVYCLSNMSHKAVRECADALDFLPMLDGYVLSCDINLIKPDKEIYDFFLNKYGLKPEECVFIDDSDKNVQAAKEAGMEALRFDNLKQAGNDLSALLEKESENEKSTYTKGQRIAALGAVGVIVLLFLAMLVCALINTPGAKSASRALLGCALVLAPLAWGYIWLVGKLTKRHTIASFDFFEEKEKDRQ